MVSNKVLWARTPWCSFAQLLSCPFIGWRRGYRWVNDKPCLQFQDHKDKDWSEEQVVHNREIASPNFTRMILEESYPGLRRCFSFFGKISLDCPLAYLYTQLQKLSSNPFYSPKSVFVGNLLDQVNGFRWYSRFLLFRLWLAFPVETEDISMPA